MTDIPVIDLQDADIKSKFRAAYGELGFGYISGHGIAPDLIQAVFYQSRAFHALPLDQKLALKAGTSHRGYIPLDASTDRTSTLAKVIKPNQSASFMILREDADTDPNVYLSGPNIWPDLPGFRDTMRRYLQAMSELARRMLPLLLDAAEVNDHSILSAFETPTTWLRLLHYPPQPAQSPDDLYGSAPHTDFGALTLLAQDPIGGLEVMTPDGAWHSAPYRPGTFVVNVGDMLHRLTNGRLLSTPHRVINRSGDERYSCPFFFDPHVHTSIAPLPDTGPARFEPIRFDTFLRGQLEATYTAHGARNGVKS